MSKTVSSMPRESHSGEPLYRRIERFIEGLIRERNLKPGDALPSLSDLVGELGVNNLTIRRSLQELAARDVVVARQGRGTFVSQGAVRRVLWVSGVDIFHGDVSAYYTDLLTQVTRELSGQSLEVEAVWVPNESSRLPKQWLDPHRLRGYVGMIFCGCKPTHPLRRQWIASPILPHVVIAQAGESGQWTVAADLAQSESLAMKLLSEAGCRRVGVIGISPLKHPGHVSIRSAETGRCIDGMELYERSFLTQSLPLMEDHRVSRVERSGFEHALNLLESTPDIDGWYLHDDVMAKGATRALLMRGIGITTPTPKVLVRSTRQHMMPLGLPASFIVSDLVDEARAAVAMLMSQLRHEPGVMYQSCKYKIVAMSPEGLPSELSAGSP